MKRILVVEDDASIRTLLTELLQTEGYVVTVAATGAEALRKVGEAPPTAIVLDLMLPDMTGQTIAETCFRRRTSNEPIPILLMSAVPHLWGIADQLRRFGVRGFMSKPFDLDIFLAAIEHLTEPAPLLAAAS